ncbi:hypothetical protein ACFQDN_26810 [Pseudomonas asuensis]
MDLNNPTLDDLKQLYASCKDKNDHHILWICSSGKVHIDRLPANVDPEVFEKETPQHEGALQDLSPRQRLCWQDCGG